MDFMAYLKNLSEYNYNKKFYVACTKAVGWLDSTQDYEKEVASERTLDLLWEFCSISVAQSRGLHECEFCIPEKIIYAERQGVKLLLGGSEIRVFAPSGDIYAAPTLIYHYVQAHKYKLPSEFMLALHEGSRPPNHLYFEKLRAIKLDWDTTTTGK